MHRLLRVLVKSRKDIGLHRNFQKVLSSNEKGSAGRRRVAPDFRFTTLHYNSALQPSDPSDGRIRPLKGPLKRL